jgi:type IV pilus assembly protein PilE
MSRISHRTRVAGFTLIELVIAMVIVAILAAIAIPAYQSQVRESRRTDAKTAVLDLAAREERYYSVQNSFTTSPLNLGYSTNAADTFPMQIGSGYYQVNVTLPTATTFNVTATAIGSQVSDTQCATFTVTDTGLRSATQSGGADNTATCWQQ